MVTGGLRAGGVDCGGIDDELETLRAITVCSPHALVIHAEGVIRWANVEAARLVGVADPVEVVGRRLDSFVENRSQDQMLERIASVLSGETPLRAQEMFLRRADGRHLVVETRGARTSWQGAPAVQVVLWDVTDRHERTQRLEWEAAHDALTGILNRRAILAALDHRLDGGADDVAGVALVDLVGFKAVNDAAGHPAGDRVLTRIAQMLETVSGVNPVGRLGGDEFLVVAGADVGRLAGTIAATVRLGQIEGRPLPAEVGTTVGVAAAPCGTVSADELVARADADLYAKRRSARG